MKHAPREGWAFLIWTLIVLGVYIRQLSINAIALGLSLERLVENMR